MKQEVNPSGNGKILYSGTPTVNALKQGSMVLFFAEANDYGWGISGNCIPGYTTHVFADVNGTIMSFFATWNKTNGTLTITHVGGLYFNVKHIVVIE